MNQALSRSTMANVGLMALRLSVGGLFIYHGWSKLMDMETTVNMFNVAFGFPAPAFFAWLTALVELLGGIAVLLGVYVRAAAKLLAIVMTVALLFVHTKSPFTMAELPLSLLSACIALVCFGGGSWALTQKDCACMVCTPKNA